MANRFVTWLLVEIAAWIGKQLLAGRPLPTIVAALVVGGLLGAAGGRIAWEFIFPGALAGALVGGLVAASLFRRTPPEPRSLGERKSDLEPFRPGPFVKVWWHDIPIGRKHVECRTALLENALYMSLDTEEMSWIEVHRNLVAGEDPQQPTGEMIRLGEIVAIEFTHPTNCETTVVHHVDGGNKTRTAFFGSASDRDELVAEIERRLGRPFERTERVMTAGRVAVAPLIVAGLVGILFVGIPWLSSYWIANPPLPPRGKPKGDDLVRLLVWAGPTNVLLAGVAAMAPAFVWLAIRLAFPPRTPILRLPTGSESRS
jgi:hypothetical protein